MGDASSAESLFCSASTAGSAAWSWNVWKEREMSACVITSDYIVMTSGDYIRMLLGAARVESIMT